MTSKPALEQAGPDRPADGTGTHDDEAHGVHSATTCQAFAVASLNPVERATALGGSVAAVPLRLVGGLAAPARGDMARNVRRAIGISEEPAPIAIDPDEAYLPPGGVARRVHADLPTMLIGGVSALLLQTLHPLAMAGVAEHSSYQEDPLGRLRRTASFVGTTTFGTVAEAEAAIAQVHRVHRRVKGIAPDGRPYSADDPELVTFIHVAEVSSFLASSQRYGPPAPDPGGVRPSTTSEVAPVALALGATWAPALGRRGGELPAAHAARALRRARRPGRPGTGCCAAWPGGRASGPSTPSCVAAAVGVLPGWARRELGLSVAGPLDLLVDTAAVTPLTRGLATALRWMVTPPG